MFLISETCDLESEEHLYTFESVLGRRLRSDRFLMSSSASTAVDLPSALLIVASILVAIYIPSLISCLRAWYILQRIPSPPVDSFFSGHAKSLTQLKRHKYEQRCIELVGKPVYKLRVFNKHVSLPTHIVYFCCTACLVARTLSVRL